jgi:hypothetical protein
MAHLSINVQRESPRFSSGKLSLSDWWTVGLTVGTKGFLVEKGGIVRG